MPLPQGTRIGPYEVSSSIGAGGMGEVYRARDSRLHRDVAIKVLPELFASDPDRLARFEREAQTLASLNHSNIAQIYGVEHSGTTRALVMELVEGEDLAQRMSRGPLPLDEALAVARQICEALEAAHERAIIHRDLKPANIRLTPGGAVKVLDFGLAKALDPSALPAAGMSAPTFTSPAVTHIGTVLGTASYMAPEQAKGKPVDRRADIWALGVMLFEMLAGRQLYTGETATETMAQVITQPPRLEALPASTPRGVIRILGRCLQKDPKHRYHSAADVRIDLDEYLAHSAEPAAPSPPTSRVKRLLPWVIAAVAAGGSLAFVQYRAWGPPPGAAAPLRMDVRLGAGEEMIVNENSDGEVAVISPDGSTIVYLARLQGKRWLFARPLNTLQSAPLSGTDAATCHFFSHDGRWVGFFSNGSLKRVALSGGTALEIAPATDPRGATWGPDDTIVFTPTTTSGLSRVSVAGGTPETLTTLGKDERTHRWPSFLPGGRAVLFIRQQANASYDDGIIEAVRLDTKERKVLIRGGTFPRYAPGFLLYFRESTMFAVRFDPDALEVLGDPQPVLTNVFVSGGIGGGAGDGAAQFSIARNGTAIYLGGAVSSVASRLAIVDRAGQQLYTYPEAKEFRDPAFSPDGGRIALDIADGRTTHLYMLDSSRGILSKLTFEGSTNGFPVWAGDGRQLAFFSDRDGIGPNIFLMRSDGSGKPTQVTSGTTAKVPSSFSPDGRRMTVMEQRGSMDAMILDLADGKLTPFQATGAQEIVPRFSPDGRWIAYHSDEFGSPEVFVRPADGGPGKWQISHDGGGGAVWTKQGKELVYVSGPRLNRVVAVPIGTDANSVIAGKPQVLFELPMTRLQNGGFMDASRDGSKFVVLLSEADSAAVMHTHVTLATGFFEEIRREAQPRRGGR